MRKKDKSKNKSSGAKLFVFLGLGVTAVATVVGVVVLIVILKFWGGAAGPLGGPDLVDEDPPPHPMTERLAGPADLTITAEQLATQMRGLDGSNKAAEKYKGKVTSLSGKVAADPQAAEREFQVMPHQILYMTGEVLELNSNRDLPGFVLKTGTQYKIKCYTNSGSERGLRPGTRIRMMGTFHAPDFEDSTILRVPSTWVFPSAK